MIPTAFKSRPSFINHTCSSHLESTNAVIILAPHAALHQWGTRTRNYWLKSRPILIDPSWLVDPTLQHQPVVDLFASLIHARGPCCKPCAAGATAQTGVLPVSSICDSGWLLPRVPGPADPSPQECLQHLLHHVARETHSWWRLNANSDSFVFVFCHSCQRGAGLSML